MIVHSFHTLPPPRVVLDHKYHQPNPFAAVFLAWPSHLPSGPLQLTTFYSTKMGGCALMAPPASTSTLASTASATSSAL